MRNRHHFFVVLGLSFASLCGFTTAASLTFNDVPADFGHIDQTTEPDIINPTQACAPTSVYNSLVYLNDKYGVDLTGPDPATTINEIGQDMGLTENNAGVSEQGIIDGKTQYIQEHDHDNKITIETKIDVANGVADAAQFIYDQLAAGQDVEMIFRWSDTDGNRSGGGHAVTVTGIDFNPSTGTGTINIDDPWGGVDITGNLHLANNALVVGYTGGAAGDETVNDEDDNPQDANFGVVTLVAAESVPEPTAVAITMLLLTGAMRLRVR